jgi:hypothetical protein
MRGFWWRFWVLMTLAAVLLVTTGIFIVSELMK